MSLERYARVIPGAQADIAKIASDLIAWTRHRWPSGSAGCTQRDNGEVCGALVLVERRGGDIALTDQDALEALGGIVAQAAS